MLETLGTEQTDGLAAVGRPATELPAPHTEAEPASAETRDTSLALEFSTYLDTSKEYSKSGKEAERRPLRVFMAQTFIHQKVQRVVPSRLRPMLVSPNQLHTNIERFFVKHPPHLPQTDERVAAQQTYVQDGIVRALDFKQHPEIYAANRLLEESRLAGNLEIEDAAAILLASYGKALIQQRGVGHHTLRGNVR